MEFDAGKITVEMQDNYRYAFLPLILCAIFVVIVLFTIYFLFRKKPEKKIEIDGEKAWRALTEQEKYNLKMKYFAMLDELDVKVQTGQISIRYCYQKLSKYVREFVSEITGVKVSRCTLNDIRYMNMPMLAALMEEYYAVEFAKVSMGDAQAAIGRTKRVIEVWN